MFDTIDYLEHLESSLGIVIPPNADIQSTYEQIYSAMTKRYGIEPVDTGIDLRHMSPGTLGEARLEGREFEGFSYFPTIAIHKNNSLYNLFKESTVHNGNIEQIYRALAEYTVAMTSCKSDAESMLQKMLEIGILVGAGTATTAAIVAAVIASGGTAAAAAAALGPSVGAAICSGVAALASYVASFINTERSFTGMVLNITNVELWVEYMKGNVYTHAGKVIALPGDPKDQRAYIPKKNGDFVHLGFYKIHNDQFSKGAEGLIRFNCEHNVINDIDIMSASPFLRGNAIGVDFKLHYWDGGADTVETAFKKLRDKDALVSTIDTDNLYAHAAVDYQRGSDPKGAVWIEQR